MAYHPSSFDRVCLPAAFERESETRNSHTHEKDVRPDVEEKGKRGRERKRERERERQMFQTRFVRVPGTSDVRPAALWLCCFDQTESRLLRDNAMIVLPFAVFKGNGDAEIGPGWSLVVIQGTSDQYAGAF